MYCESLIHYKRRYTNTVRVGPVNIGSDAPIVIQTMTSKATSDIDGSVEQILKADEAGAQIVRVTVPSMRDVEHIRAIKEKLLAGAHHIPLVADIHFNQKIAFEAAKLVEKVRINPGNFADSKKFEQLDYSDTEYAAELDRIRQEFLPLLHICREHNTALRIGTNHGSLSDRIMSRYGDTPEGMVESAMEFLRFCKQENFMNVVVSMKASNTMIMVQSVRLLAVRMKEENMHFPLHLGVTEAGEGEDGRIKSAVGIGALLADGIGDTIRVSLTEEPECEIPVARKLVMHFANHTQAGDIPPFGKYFINPFSFTRRQSTQVLQVGGKQVPVVIADSQECSGNLHPDFVFINHHQDPIPDIQNLVELDNKTDLNTKNNLLPLVTLQHKDLLDFVDPCFVRIRTAELNNAAFRKLQVLKNKVLVLSSNNLNMLADLRSAIVRLTMHGIKLPVIVKICYQTDDIETLQVKAAADSGGLLLDGLVDGIWIANTGNVSQQEVCSVSFGILQASRMRTTKPEYISCPSCGRTQFNIQETTRYIRERTRHLTGLKIGIMGCIVNGLGEMADADYGYIGGAPGKVNLYHQKELIKRGVPENLAVDELINLIKDRGDWVEP
jgi:(E)-4-hydroxy-3-methylbut-2-enyl-diphosphate synthase